MILCNINANTSQALYFAEKGYIVPFESILVFQFIAGYLSNATEYVMRIKPKKKIDVLPQ